MTKKKGANQNLENLPLMRYIDYRKRPQKGICLKYLLLYRFSQVLNNNAIASEGNPSSNETFLDLEIFRLQELGRPSLMI